jgi:hypothetical protein
MTTLSPLPSPWQAMRGKLILYAVMSVLLGVLLGLEDPAVGLAAALLVFVITATLEWRAAQQLSRALAAFAREIPEPGEPASTLLGHQGLAWPARGIEVLGWTWRFRVQPLNVVAGERAWEVPPGEASAAAREAWSEVADHRRRRHRRRR